MIFCTVQQANANEIILEKNFAGYFDSDGVYTVVGKINNAQEYPVIPIITITIEDDNNLITESYQLATVYPASDQPFKFKFPQITSSNPILKEPQVLFNVTQNKIPLSVEVIYDQTLVTHKDGHKTGRIINNGEKTVENVKIYALIYDSNWKLLDMGKNIEMIEKIEPGQIIDFSMYPDPLFSSQAHYYSCFVIGDEAIIPVNTIRNDKEYKYRYDSGIWFAYPE
ncbi:MAG: peptidase, partial [Nitrosopumilaceae archaeon]